MGLPSSSEAELVRRAAGESFSALDSSSWLPLTLASEGPRLLSIEAQQGAVPFSTALQRQELGTQSIEP